MVVLVFGVAKNIKKKEKKKYQSNMSHIPTSSLCKMNRNLIERERRSTMRSLFFRLLNLLPPHPTKMSLPQRVECAMVYIKQLKERVEELKRRKVQLQGPITSVQQPQCPGINNEIITPVLQITDSESTVEVYLIAEAGTRTRFVVRDIITILEEEGAEVLSVNYHTMGNMILVSVYSQAAYSRIGIENCQVHERLRRLQISLKQIP